eukprot:GHVT01054560.1.p1 GENE.GHVT01054560.1~~GHVT01054560.1.p1  ORF type:complete len:332 (-),score=13.23 GHVT01054560.1:1419-2414(-)
MNGKPFEFSLCSTISFCAGICKESSLVFLKIFDAESGVSTTADIISAMNYALGQGFKLSYHGWTAEYSDVVAQAFEFAHTYGHVAVGAAGDTNTTTLDFPASLQLPNIISACALDKNGQKWENSTYGPDVDVCALGALLDEPEGIPFERSPVNSTKNSAAVVTGAFALIWSSNPGIAWEEIISIMKDTSVGITDSTNTRVQLGRAVNLAMRKDTTTTTPAPAGPPPNKCIAYCGNVPDTHSLFDERKLVAPLVNNGTEFYYFPISSSWTSLKIDVDGWNSSSLVLPIALLNALGQVASLVVNPLANNTSQDTLSLYALKVRLTLVQCFATR